LRHVQPGGERAGTVGQWRALVVRGRALETMTGASFPLETASSCLKGAREIDLVRSGLDDIMRSAYGQISAMWNVKSEIPDLRTAAYSIAISRCADAYSAIGI
jgi:glutamate dehydrogenase (NAD(P)+)